jgi:hypothetical protein
VINIYVGDRRPIQLDLAPDEIRSQPVIGMAMARLQKYLPGGFDVISSNWKPENLTTLQKLVAPSDLKDRFANKDKMKWILSFNGFEASDSRIRIHSGSVDVPATLSDWKFRYEISKGILNNFYVDSNALPAVSNKKDWINVKIVFADFEASALTLQVRQRDLQEMGVLVQFEDWRSDINARIAPKRLAFPWDE